MSARLKAALPLDDKRWSGLWCRNGTADNLPEHLGRLLAHPEDRVELDWVGGAICSDGTTWSSGFAAAPYIAEIARRLPPRQRVNPLTEMGCIVAGVCIGSDNPHLCIHSYLKDGYHQAIRDCVRLLAETLVCDHNPNDTLNLLFAAAALKGHIRLAEVLANLDCCPNCSVILERA